MEMLHSLPYRLMYLLFSSMNTAIMIRQWSRLTDFVLQVSVHESSYLVTFW